MIVSASRGTPQDPLNVPQAVATITQEQIDQTVKTDVNDYLHTIPGVGLAPRGGRG